MSGYQVVVMGEPHKDAWFAYQSQMFVYRDLLREQGYHSVARFTTREDDITVMSE